MSLLIKKILMVLISYREIFSLIHYFNHYHTQINSLKNHQSILLIFHRISFLEHNSLICNYIQHMDFLIRK